LCLCRTQLLPLVADQCCCSRCGNSSTYCWCGNSDSSDQQLCLLLLLPAWLLSAAITVAVALIIKPAQQRSIIPIKRNTSSRCSSCCCCRCSSSMPHTDYTTLPLLLVGVQWHVWAAAVPFEEVHDCPAGVS
jgi:hypothetical protein